MLALTSSLFALTRDDIAAREVDGSIFGLKQWSATQLGTQHVPVWQQGQQLASMYGLEGGSANRWTASRAAIDALSMPVSMPAGLEEAGRRLREWGVVVCVHAH